MEGTLAGLEIVQIVPLRQEGKDMTPRLIK
jgi:hypothetical protein